VTIEQVDEPDKTRYRMCKRTGPLRMIQLAAFCFTPNHPRRWYPDDGAGLRILMVLCVAIHPSDRSGQETGTQQGLEPWTSQLLAGAYQLDQLDTFFLSRNSQYIQGLLYVRKTINAYIVWGRCREVPSFFLVPRILQLNQERKQKNISQLCRCATIETIYLHILLRTLLISWFLVLAREVCASIWG
jgi:hypothetical protein